MNRMILSMVPSSVKQQGKCSVAYSKPITYVSMLFDIAYLAKLPY